MNFHGTQTRHIFLPLLICCLAAFPCLEQGGLASATTSARHTVDDTATTCVPLQGIESNATGTLDAGAFIDLDAIMVSLAEEVFHPDNPIIPTVAGCAASLETPIAMRNLLGKPLSSCCSPLIALVIVFFLTSYPRGQLIFVCGTEHPTEARNLSCTSGHLSFSYRRLEGTHDISCFTSKKTYLGCIQCTTVS